MGASGADAGGMANGWTPASRPGSAGPSVTYVGGSPAVVVAEGGLGAVFGVVVLAWPGPTATVLATLFAAQLFATALVQLVAASSTALSTGDRVLSCGLATLSLLIGLLCLRAPLQTPALLGLLMGIMWVLGGAIRVGQGSSATPARPEAGGSPPASCGCWPVGSRWSIRAPDSSRWRPFSAWC